LGDIQDINHVRIALPVQELKDCICAEINIT